MIARNSWVVYSCAIYTDFSFNGIILTASALIVADFNKHNRTLALSRLIKFNLLKVLNAAR